MTTIHIDGMDDLLDRITTLAQLKGIGKYVKAAAIHVKGKIAHYPAQRHGPNPGLYGSSARAERMRRGFFARLRSGEIEVPYRRGASPGSESLGRKWTIAQSNAGLTATVGNNVSYGPLVQSDKRQTAYHAATGWKTVEQVRFEERTTVIDFIRDGIERLLS